MTKKLMINEVKIEFKNVHCLFFAFSSVGRDQCNRFAKQDLVYFHQGDMKMVLVKEGLGFWF